MSSPETQNASAELLAGRGGINVLPVPEDLTDHDQAYRYMQRFIHENFRFFERGEMVIPEEGDKPIAVVRQFNQDHGFLNGLPSYKESIGVYVPPVNTAGAFVPYLLSSYGRNYGPEYELIFQGLKCKDEDELRGFTVAFEANRPSVNEALNSFVEFIT